MVIYNANGIESVKLIGLNFAKFLSQLANRCLVTWRTDTNDKWAHWSCSENRKHLAQNIRYSSELCTYTVGQKIPGVL